MWVACQWWWKQDFILKQTRQWFLGARNLTSGFRHRCLLISYFDQILKGPNVPLQSIVSIFQMFPSLCRFSVLYGLHRYLQSDDKLLWCQWLILYSWFHTFWLNHTRCSDSFRHFTEWQKHFLALRGPELWKVCQSQSILIFSLV